MSNFGITAKLLADSRRQLDVIHKAIGRQFARSEQRERVRDYMDALIAVNEQLSGRRLAQRAGEGNPYGMQRLLSAAHWSADGVRDDLQEYVRTNLRRSEAVLVIAEAGFAGPGPKAVGLERQYNPLTDRIEMCQIGIFLVYARHQVDQIVGDPLIDRDLYLSRRWTNDFALRRTTGVPESVQYRSKTEIAIHFLKRAMGTSIPWSWVTAGLRCNEDGRLRIWLEDHQHQYVLEIGSDTLLKLAITDNPLREFEAEMSAEALVASLDKFPNDHEQPKLCWIEMPSSESRSLVGGTANKWTLIPVTIPNRARGTRLYETYNWTHMLLVRRAAFGPGPDRYYIAYSHQPIELNTAAKLAEENWLGQASIDAARVLAGLDKYKTWQWNGWYRHVTLSMLVHASMVVAASQPDPA